MMMIEDFKKDIKNSLKGVQENTGKQLEALKKETQKSLKELQENTIQQVKEMNKTIQDLKMRIETIKKSKRETTLEMENLGKKSGVIDATEPTEYKRQKRESQVQKTPQRTSAQQSKKMENAKRS